MNMMTNIERIRSMTDEELADWLTERFSFCCDCGQWIGCPECSDFFGGCIADRDCLEKWLKEKEKKRIESEQWHYKPKKGGDADRDWF